MTPDPSTGSNAGDPGSWNKYAYVQGDPVNFTDRQGLFIDNCQLDGIPVGCPPSNLPMPECPPEAFGGCVAPEPPPEGPWPEPSSSERAWTMYVIAGKDCYTQHVGSLAFVWERDIDYYAFKVYDDGEREQLTAKPGDRSIIDEQVTRIYGPDPQPNNPPQPGRPFEDTLSVANGPNYKRLQTFTVSYQGTTYNAMIRSLAGAVTSSNTIEATKDYVNINDKNIDKQGHYPICQ